MLEFPVSIPLPRRAASVRRIAAALTLGMAAAVPAWAIDFGTLRLYLPAGEPAYAEITLSDSAPLDPADIRARIATPDAYGVANMRYVPALQGITLTPQAGPGGQVVLRLDRLPAPGDVPEIDLLLLVGDRMSLALGEYRVNLRGASREFGKGCAGRQWNYAVRSSCAQAAASASARMRCGAAASRSGLIDSSPRASSSAPKISA